jgi:hypothetical protein
MATNAITNLGAFPSLRKMNPLHITRKVKRGTINETTALPIQATKSKIPEFCGGFSLVSIDIFSSLSKKPAGQPENQLRSQQGDWLINHPADNYKGFLLGRPTGVDGF